MALTPLSAHLWAAQLQPQGKHPLRRRPGGQGVLAEETCAVGGGLADRRETAGAGGLLRVVGMLDGTRLGRASWAVQAAVTCRDAPDLYRYLTERVAPLDGVRELETAPVIRTVKRAGAVLP